MKKCVEELNSEYKKLLVRLNNLENLKIINSEPQSNNSIEPYDAKEEELQARLDALMFDEKLSSRIDSLQRFDHNQPELTCIDPRQLEIRRANLKNNSPVDAENKESEVVLASIDSDDEESEVVLASIDSDDEEIDELEPVSPYTPADILQRFSQSTNLFSIYNSAISNISDKADLPLKQFKVK